MTQSVVSDGPAVNLGAPTAAGSGFNYGTVILLSFDGLIYFPDFGNHKFNVWLLQKSQMPGILILYLIQCRLGLLMG